MVIEKGLLDLFICILEMSRHINIYGYRTLGACGNEMSLNIPEPRCVICRMIEVNLAAE